MLDKARFLKGLKYLNAFYSNFKFDINDDFKIGVWYQTFSGFTDDSFTDLVKNYCEQNIYAPQSPAHLLEFAKSVISTTFMNSKEAWEYALDNIRRLGYDFRRFYMFCEYKVISDVIRLLEWKFRGIRTEDLKFVQIEFEKMYQEAITVQSAQILQKGQFLLSNPKQIALDYKVGGDFDED